MCGILGCPETIAEHFPRAMERLAFRGRDQSAAVSMDSYRLGCQRLAITDPSSVQPLVAGVPGRRTAIVFNGSLAGSDALARELEAIGEAPLSRNDAELPLRLYRARGLRGLERLRGQFAFGILDEERGCLVLGRDVFGEKPLFVREQEHGLPAFASTLAGLQALHPEPLPGPDPLDVARFLRFGWLDLEESCFGVRVRSFPRSRIRLYDRSGLVEECRLDSVTTSRTGVRLPELLTRSVSERLTGDRPIGLFLSGGIDSACLAWALARLNRRVLCLSLDLEGLEPESGRARAIAACLGLEHRAWTAGPELLETLPELIASAGHPLGDPSILALSALAKHAVDSGIGIALSGEGGDELFLGYRRQRALPWIELARTLLPPFFRQALARGARGVSQRSRLRRALVGGYAELLSVADPADIAELVPGVEGEGPEPLRLPDHARDTELEGYLPWDLCPKADLGGLSAGLEIRLPFLDPRLRGFADRRARRSGESHGKPLLRELLSAALPNELRSGPKRGFAVPLAAWLRVSSWPREVLGDPSLAACPWSRERALEWLRELEQGDDRRAPLLFNLCSLATWWQQSRWR
ncbi:MAG: asparagine synthetase B family protein [Planctomycetota bacterium]